MSTEISIIIPLYRSSDSLPSSLLSALSQDFPLPYEIILCPFGADKDALLLAHDFAFRYPERVEIVESPINYGVSASRNVGMIKARGNYLLFLDSDDELEPNALSSLYQETQKKDYDIVTGGFYTEKGKRNHFSLSFQGKGRTVLKKFLSSPLTPFAPYCWARLYRKDFLERNKVRFPMDMDTFEDWVFFAKAFLFANEIKSIKTPIYHYVQNPDSKMHRKPDSVSGCLAAISRIKDFLSVYAPDLEAKYLTKPNLAMKMKLKYASEESEAYYQKSCKEIYAMAYGRYLKILGGKEQ